MESYRLGFNGLRPNGFFGLRTGRSLRQSCRKLATAAAAASATAANSSYIQRVQGLTGPWNAATTSGVLSALGDLLAQSLLRYEDQQKGKAGDPYNPWRTLRMFGFGFCWYGPFQYYWYNALDWMMPIRNTVNFLSKVTANQLLLAPCTLTAVFCWNLSLMDKAEHIPDKLKNDLLPTMKNGWKFWVPAASLNFYCVPIQLQVLYMSCCGLLWTAYLSYASVTPQAAAPAAAPAAVEPAPKVAPAPEGKQKKKGKR